MNPSDEKLTAAAAAAFRAESPAAEMQARMDRLYSIATDDTVDENERIHANNELFILQGGVQP